MTEDRMSPKAPTPVDTPPVAAVRPWRGGANVRSFAVALLVVLTVFTVAIFVWINARTDALVSAGALEQARSYADLIVAARAWNSAHGGVYVKKTATVLTNPYLLQLGVKADDMLSDGTSVTLRNPAVMTREIGEQLKASGAPAVFKLTSLDPVNPANAPDAWERGGLQAFERGAPEMWATQETGRGEDVFRYMRPLVVDESCLRCHDRDTYTVGDVRGALSITLPHDDFAEALRENRRGLVLIGGGVLVGLWVAVTILVVWLQRRLRQAGERLEHMATVDALTGLWNRSQILERLEAELERARRRGAGGGTGVVMVDIDHFKRVNDTFGHAAGDEALRATGVALAGAVRTYDSVGRIGGEEMLVIVPDVDERQLADLGERIRAAVEQVELPPTCAGCALTVSAGTALASSENAESADTLVARADAALYAAKDAGRNRVVAG